MSRESAMSADFGGREEDILYDPKPELDFQQSRIMGRLETTHLNVRHEIHVLNLQMQHLEDLHFNSMSMLFRELHEAKMELQDRRELEERSRAEWEREMAESHRAATQAFQQKIDQKRERIGVLTGRSEELNAAIKEARHQLEDGECLHETRTVKLTGAIQSLKDEISGEMERYHQLAEEDSALRAEIAVLEKNLAAAKRTCKSNRRQRDVVVDECRRMRSDHRDLRRAEYR
jgi:chromosome segregation ATPase